MPSIRSIARNCLPALMLLCALGAHAQNAPAAPCAVTVEMRDFDEYYPPGSIRRAEEGEVIIAFKATPGSTRPSDIAIIRASEFPDLDVAALQIARSLRVNSPCFAQTVRWAFNFDYEPPEPDPRPVKQHGCLTWTPRGTGYVLLVPDEYVDL